MDKKHKNMLCMICCLSYQTKKPKKNETDKNEEINQVVAQFGKEILSEWRPRPPQQRKPSNLKEEEDVANHYGEDVEGQEGQIRGKCWKKRKRGRKRLGLEEVIERLEAGGCTAEVNIKNEGEEGVGVASPATGVNMEEKITAILESCKPDNISVCPECMANMKNATEARTQATAIEKRVRKLQLLLMKGLRCLHQQMNRFYVEMEKVEDNVFNADVSCLDAVLSFVGSKKSKLVIGKPFFGITPVNRYTIRRERVLRFRNQIFDVTRDLQKYRSEIQEKFFHEVSDHDQDTPSMMETEPTPNPVNVKVEVDIESMEQSDHEVDHSPPFDFGAGDDDDFDFNSENEFFSNVKDSRLEEQIPGTSAQPARKKSKLSIPTADEYETKDVTEDGVDDKIVEDSSESENYSDEDYNPIKAKKWKTNKKPSGESASVSDFTKTFLKNLPDFKRRVAKHVLKKQHSNNYLRRKPQPKDGRNWRTPYQQQMLELEYHPEQKVILLKGVVIRILDKSENPELEENGLECTECSFRVPASDDEKLMEYKMYDHVISKHLEGYPCPVCEFKLETDLEYRTHVKACKEMKEKEAKVDCTVCGKTLSCQRSLDYHRWSHMNEEEKKELIESGVTPPIDRQKNKDRSLQCQICGKGFKFSNQLTTHEEIHKSREEREQRMCPKCGKSFLKAGWDYHEKYSDCAENQVTTCVECPVCKKSIKNKHILRKHIKEQHSDETEVRRFICPQCGKGFKHQTNLRNHEVTHTGLKPFQCDGCGSAFGRYTNMMRHKKTCPSVQGGHKSSQGSRIIIGTDSSQQDVKPPFHEYFAGVLQ